MPFYFTKCPFIPRTAFFPELIYYFQILPFCFRKLPLSFQEGPFYFSKMLYCFPELPFSFPEVPSLYLLGTSFPNNVFFPDNFTFFLSSSKLLKKIIIPLLLFCFLFRLYLFTYLLNLCLLYFQKKKLNPSSNHYQIKWFKVTSILDNVKTSTWSMAFYVFYSNVSLHDSLENAVSEHF